MPEQQTKAQTTLNRILDAAMACYEKSGISGTRLEDVAKSAGVGRTTLYRYVKNRDDLLNQVLLRDAQAQRAEMEVLNRYHDNLADAVVESTLLVLRGRRTRPINRLLFANAEDTMIERINLSPSSFKALTEALLAPKFEKALANGELREGVTLAEASDWVARITLSLVTYPEDFLNDDDALRRYLRAFLVPSLLKDAS
ncbi:MAG: TetR family transcriptional regulator [Pseudomonadales bacterium]